MQRNMRKKRIGIDAHMLGDHSGGNESYYKNLLEVMEIPNDLTIFLFVRPGVDTSQYEKRGFRIVRFKSKNAFARNFVELTVLSRELKLDVLHTQYFIPFIRPCDVVCTIHDICFEHFKDIFTKKEYIRQKLLIPYAARHSRRIITVSEFSKTDISESYRINKDIITVAYSGPSDDFRRLEKEEVDISQLKDKFGIDRDRNYVLSVGNLQPRKNLIRLIQAFRLLKQDPYRSEQLVIVGKKAWMYDDIMKEALEGSEDIIFTDYVEGSDLVSLYNAASCFVYPSFFEGFGLPPIEAMACGTPVAAAEAASLPEVVGDAGIYFDPFSLEEIRDAIKRLLEDGTLRKELITKGYERRKRYSWKKSAEIIINTYRES